MTVLEFQTLRVTVSHTKTLLPLEMATSLGVAPGPLTTPQTRQAAAGAAPYFEAVAKPDSASDSASTDSWSAITSPRNAVAKPPPRREVDAHCWRHPGVRLCTRGRSHQPDAGYGSGVYDSESACMGFRHGRQDRASSWVGGSAPTHARLGRQRGLLDYT